MFCLQEMRDDFMVHYRESNSVEEETMYVAMFGSSHS